MFSPNGSVATFVIAFASFEHVRSYGQQLQPVPLAETPAQSPRDDETGANYAQLWNSLSSSPPVFVTGLISV